jgi:hypothetical protein
MVNSSLILIGILNALSCAAGRKYAIFHLGGAFLGRRINKVYIEHFGLQVGAGYLLELKVERVVDDRLYASVIRCRHLGIDTKDWS